MTTLNADINDVAKCLRVVTNDVENLKMEITNSCNILEFDRYLATGQLQIFILKRVLEKLGYKLEEGSRGAAARHGREFFITREETQERISINLEAIPSGNHRFEISCDDEGKVTRNNVDYFLLMTYKFIYFVKPERVVIENPQVKTKSDGEKFYDFDTNRARSNAEQVIQISELVVF